MISLNMSSLFLKNANVIDVSTGNISLQNIRIESGIIQEIGKNGIKDNSAKSIDLKGDFVMPGLCDAHVPVTAFTAEFARL